MKKILSLMLIGLLVLFLVSCSSTDTSTEVTSEDLTLEEEIVGTWESKESLNYKAENDKEETMEVSSVYEFSDDGTYILDVTVDSMFEDDMTTTDKVSYVGTYKIESDELITTVEEINGNNAVDFKVEDTQPGFLEVHTYLTDGKNHISITDDILTISTEYKYGDNDKSIDQEFIKVD